MAKQNRKPRTPKNVTIAEPVRIERHEDEPQVAEQEAPELTTDAEITAAIAEALAESAAEPAVKLVVTGSVIPPAVKKAYGKSQSCNDTVAMWLSKLLKEGYSLQQVGEANAVNTAGRWGHLNVGMQRMNLGNVLRNRAKEGTTLERPTGEPAVVKQAA